MPRKTAETTGETVVSQNLRMAVQYSNPANPNGETLVVDNTANNGEVIFTIGETSVTLPNETVRRMTTTFRRMTK